MKLAHHYRTLGLRQSASFGEVKKAYRQLVRKYHPDINPDKAAIDRFIKINAAYTTLCEALQPEFDRTAAAETRVRYGSVIHASPTSSAAPSERLNFHVLKRKFEKLGLCNFQQNTHTPNSTETKGDSTSEKGTAAEKSSSAAESAEETESQPFSMVSASAQDLRLKQEAYNQLKGLLRQQKFPRAIALIEGLAHRIPADQEVTQWRAIVYQRWGRQLSSSGHFKQALQTDPNNPSLEKEVSRDLGLLKHLQAAEAMS